MTVLEACQDAASQLRPAQAVPTAIFASTDPFARELGALSNEAARAIAKVHDWRRLTLLKTQAGDGSATEFDLPTDYDRMPVKGGLFSTAHELKLEPVDDLDEWLDREIRSFVGSIGYWIILSGSLHIKPVMAATESAKYYYITKYIAQTEAGVNKEKFTLDSDVFRLPERLLTLSLIWRWRHRKGLDYTEDMRNFEIAAAEEQSRDKGSRILRVGKARLPDGINYAFPGVINAS